MYRVEGDEVEVVICGQRSQDGWRWGLPKGTPDSGETLEQTAVREVKEETGLKVELDAPIGSIQYWFVRSNDGVRCHKTVHFYLMNPVGGSFSDHDQEFDEVRWCPSKEALGDLAYKNEVNILEKAVEIVSQRARKRDF